MYCDHNKDCIPSQDSLKEGMCPVKWALDCVSTARDNDCGKAVTCRDGLAQLKVVIAELAGGQAEAEDIELVEAIAKYMATTPGCELAELTAKNVLWSLNTYRSEWDAHRRKRCAAKECYYEVIVDPAKCSGCGKCPGLCSYGAIAGGAGLISVVDNNACKHCGKCLTECPEGAIMKAGLVKPALPSEPVPVGSFSGEEAGGRRRRRRGSEE